MDIEQKKERFLSILATLHQVEDGEVIRVSEGALLENELGRRDFWDIICPSLKKQGVLKEYSDPDSPLSAFFASYIDSHAYKVLAERRYPMLMDFQSDRIDLSKPGLTKQEIKELDAEMEAVRVELRARYYHKFIIDLDRLNAVAKKPADTLAASGHADRIKIYVSQKKGIYIDEQHRYGISGKRFECVQRFLGAEFLTAADLEEFWATSSQTTNEIKEINRLVRDKLDIEDDLIVHSESARSYSLNTEKMDVSAV